LRVAARSELADCIIGTGTPFSGQTNHPRYIQQAQRFMMRTAGLRHQGAVALDLAYVAAGRFDGFWEEHVKSWDMAAGILIVRESGGTVTDITGGEKMMSSGSVLASNEPIHALMLEQLNKVPVTD
jgi:myo-inositol-1(or 4)-monophosphatase